MKLFGAAVAAFVLVAVSPIPAAAQATGRPITIIVPYTPGTGIDILARALGSELAKLWGQPVVVDNKPGASGNIGTQVAARAAPDGQTLLMIAKTFVTNVSLFKNVPYDPVTSFTPVVKLATGSIVLAVHPSVPAATAPAFVQYVKARPGAVNYGSPGFATPHHLAMELFKHATQTDLVHIPYKGTSGVMSDLVGNHVSAMFVPTHVALPLAADKQIRILGVASAERVPAAPDVPTLAEQGITGFDVDIWFALLAPAGTPAEVVARYNATINAFLRSPALVDTLAKQGLITAGGPPEVLRELIATDMAKWQKVIQQAGITAE
ncbi:MAG TPA: tripartite tricarboxylate transporter substrate binding protein [Xanthobacteraceae bacterium]|nr:tripartite tricarboxylate transporter substrate binding protein [Xanthobacteraceae bacterium]